MDRDNHLDSTHGLPKKERFECENINLGIPPLPSCYVVSVAGVVADDLRLHRALGKYFIPHSAEFVRDLIDAVRNQRPLNSEIVAQEELIVRQAVENAGDKHGTSGFQDRVAWLGQDTTYYSSKPERDPYKQGKSFVTLTSFELYDPRAYRDAKLTLCPNREILVMGTNSILGQNPTFIFDLGPSGHTKFQYFKPFLDQLSDAVPSQDWSSFKGFEAIEHIPRFKGCYSARTTDGLQLILRSPLRASNNAQPET